MGADHETSTLAVDRRRSDDRRADSKRRAKGSEMIAANLDIEGIRQRIGADSLAYLSMAGLTKSVRNSIDVPETGHCNACFSGDYPAPLVDLDKGLIKPGEVKCC